MRTGWRPAGVAVKYSLNKPDLSPFRKFEVPLECRQQIYLALQFAVYVGMGSYLMNFGEHLPLGLGTLVLGLFVLGAALENRPWALRLE